MKKLVVVGEEAPKNNNKNSKQQNTSIGRFFIETLYWIILDADVLMVEEAKNLTFKITSAPTIDEFYGTSIPVKHNLFNDKFDIPVFKIFSHIPQRWANGGSKNNKYGTFIHEGGIINKGYINPRIVKKYKLTPDTIPDGFAEISVPF